MNEYHPDVYHICEINLDIIELEIFKIVKIELLIDFFLRICLGLVEYFVYP